MDDGFFLFSEYRDEGSEAKHYICGDYHLWVWADGVGAVRKFEFQYQDKRIRYADGEFSHGSENYIMPMFFIIDHLFGCDANVEAKLLGIGTNTSLGCTLPVRNRIGGLWPPSVQCRATMTRPQTSAVASRQPTPCGWTRGAYLLPFSPAS